MSTGQIIVVVAASVVVVAFAAGMVTIAVLGEIGLWRDDAHRMRGRPRRPSQPIAWGFVAVGFGVMAFTLVGLALLTHYT